MIIETRKVINGEYVSLDDINLNKITQTDLAKLLNTSVQNLRTWAKTNHPEEIGKFPTYVAQGNKNLYSFYECLTWYVKYQAFTRYRDALNSVSIDGTNVEASKAEGDARRSMANAQMAELDLAKAQGNLVDASDVKNTFDDLVLRLRSKILGIPSRFAIITVDGLSAPEKEDLYTDETNDLLRELSKTNEES